MASSITLLCLVTVLVIVGIVLYFTVPKFAHVTGGTLAGFIVGFAVCYLLMYKKDKQ